ncbi:hypothetical protein M0R04_09770 [Candidatus Dojkabacteria bacterium]|jgi:hypothetical protein|nr:hypothetical protein [Candidatus Dojkabacteria bacterium]
MSWKKIDPADGKPRYIKGSGNFYYLSKDKKSALDDIPQGWKIIAKSGRLALVRER